MSKPKLKTLRQQRGLTLKHMADLCGCSESYLSRLENGIAGTTMEPALAERIGKAYKCRIRLKAERIVR